MANIPVFVVAGFLVGLGAYTVGYLTGRNHERRIQAALRQLGLWDKPADK